MRLLHLLPAATAVLLQGCIAVAVDKLANAVDRDHAAPASPASQAIHHHIPVMDLHCDQLLWDRPLLERATRGHVDVPRLLDGGVALQVFSVVSRTPMTLNTVLNPGTGDSLMLLAMAQGWPVATWTSPLERTLFQAAKLEQAEKDSHGTFRVVKTQAHLDAFLAAWEKDHAQAAGLLALEGGSPMEGRLENVEVLFKAGVRMASLSHFTDTDLGGSAHGWDKGGITPLGVQVVQRMEALGITVDVSHASPALLDDLFKLVKRPVVVSHTGVKGTCDTVRNISDAHVKAVAATGGVVGIGFFERAVCGVGVEHVVNAAAHVAKLVGVEYVGLGSDFDGLVTTPVDASQLEEITHAFLQRGFTAEEVGKIMGGNVLRVLRSNLPAQ